MNGYASTAPRLPVASPSTLPIKGLSLPFQLGDQLPSSRGPAPNELAVQWSQGQGEHRHSRVGVEDRVAFLGSASSSMKSRTHALTQDPRIPPPSSVSKVAWSQSFCLQKVCYPPRRVFPSLGPASRKLPPRLPAPT